MKVLIFVLAGILMTLVVGLGLYQRVYSDNYFQEFNESFAGRVLNIKEKGRYDIVLIKLDKSTTSCYSTVYSENVLFCLIRDTLAELAMSSFNVNEGDEISYDGKTDIIRVSDERGLKTMSPAYLSPIPWFNPSPNDFELLQNRYSCD